MKYSTSVSIVQAKEEAEKNIEHFKTWHVNFFYIVGKFCSLGYASAWSGTSQPKSMQIHADPDPNPKHFQIHVSQQADGGGGVGGIKINRWKQVCR